MKLRENPGRSGRRTEWNRRHGAAAALLSDTLTIWLRRTGTPLKYVAGRLGVGVSTVSAWATGHRFPDENHLDALSAYTGLAIRCLFCDHTDCHEGTTIDGRPHRSVRLHAKWQDRVMAHTARVIIEKASAIDDYQGAMELILCQLREYTRMECAAFRVRDCDGDYPYVAYSGFSKRFIEKENFLVRRDRRGRVRRDRDGRPALECMCGNVLRQRVDPRLPCFTEHGSFWTNSTTDFIASTTVKDRQSPTRNTCNAAGYESVGLFPLVVDGEYVGLLQLNDRRRNMFARDAVPQYEALAANLAAFVANLTFLRDRPKG